MNNNNNNTNFEKFCHEANTYFNNLSSSLGHPEEKDRVIILWKAVMHTIRERIHIGESLDFISSMPLLLKGMYVHNWKYHNEPSLEFESIEGKKKAVKSYQEKYGEMNFSWNKSTEELISIVIDLWKNTIAWDNSVILKDKCQRKYRKYFNKRKRVGFKSHPFYL